MKTSTPLYVYDDTKGKAECRSCHAKITWFELVSGKRHPFDGEPVYLRTHTDDSGRLIGHIDRADSHFATCPQSREWSRK